MLEGTNLVMLVVVLRMVVVLRLGLGLGHVGLVICMALWGIVSWESLVMRVQQVGRNETLCLPDYLKISLI